MSDHDPGTQNHLSHDQADRTATGAAAGPGPDGWSADGWPAAARLPDGSAAAGWAGHDPAAPDSGGGDAYSGPGDTLQWSGPPWPDHADPGTFIPLSWSPPEPVPPRRRRWRTVVGAGLALVLLAAAGGLGYLAYNNDQTARRWRSLEQSQAARAAALTRQLRTANARIVTLDAQVGTLNAEAGSLQNQLSSVADQKEKAVDQETLLHQLLSAAGTVTGDLQQCITATNQFDSDLNAAVGSGQLTQFTALQQEAAQVDQTCNQAETANQQLQSAISAAP